MSLNSLHFIVLFCILLILLSIISLIRKTIGEYELLKQLQISLLLIFSLFFIAIWDWRYCVCSVVYTVFVYTLGILTEKRHSRTIMLVGIFGSIIMLGYFKYTNFFINSFTDLFGVKI